MPTKPIDKKLRESAIHAAVAASNSGPGGTEGYRQVIAAIAGVMALDHGERAAVRVLAEIAAQLAPSEN